MTYKVTNINGLTGEVIVRDMNADELAQLEKDKATAKATADAQAATLAAKAAARQAVLDKLGLTADEVKALLG